MSRHPQDATATRMLADRTGTDPADWFLVFKARYGMEVVFRALAEARGPGDVVTQVFTCSTAVDPVLVAGLRPVYAEVSPATVAIDPDRLAVGPDTRAVVLQNTFGIVDEAAARRLRDAARSVGALLVEDSAHCVGRLARDADGTPVADVSFHSFGVEKLLPTRFGGAVWVSPALDPALRAATVAALDALPVVGPRLDLAARSFRTQVRVLNRLPGAAAGKVRGALTAVGAHEPAIAPVENRGGLAHPPQRPSAWVVDRMVDALRSAATPRRAAPTRSRSTCAGCRASSRSRPGSGSARRSCGSRSSRPTPRPPTVWSPSSRPPGSTSASGTGRRCSRARTTPRSTGTRRATPRSRRRRTSSRAS